MEKETIGLKCEKCENGIVEVTRDLTKKHEVIKVKKCSHCKYQYGIKGMGTLKLA